MAVQIMSNESKVRKTRKLIWFIISCVAVMVALFIVRFPFNHFALLEYDWGQFRGTHSGPLFPQVETMLTDFRTSSSECDISALQVIVGEREIRLIPRPKNQMVADGWIRDDQKSDGKTDFWYIESEWGECEVTMQAGEPKSLLLLLKNGPHRVHLKGLGKSKAETVVLPATTQKIVSTLGIPTRTESGILH